MPGGKGFASMAQSRWAHSASGRKAGFDQARLDRWEAETDWEHLPIKSSQQHRKRVIEKVLRGK